MSDDSFPEPEGPRDQLRAEAAMWFARMRGEDAETHRAAFEAWLARGAVHRAAYNRIGEIFAAGKALKGMSDPSVAPSPATHWLPLLAVLIVTLLFGFTAWQMIGSTRTRVAGASTAANAEHVTLPGRLTLIRSASGDEILLDTDTLVVTSVSDQPTLSRLERGRVRVTARAGSPTSVILAGATEVVSDGGTYDLWLQPDGSLDAQVLKGGIVLRPAIVAAFGGEGKPLRLLAGQRVRLDAAGRRSVVAYRPGTDWPRGVLEFRSVPLDAVLAEANRYSVTKIALGDPVLAALPVSGRFRVDAPERLADHLAVALVLRIDRTRRGLIVLRRP